MRPRPPERSARTDQTSTPVAGLCDPGFSSATTIHSSASSKLRSASAAPSSGAITSGPSSVVPTRHSWTPWGNQVMLWAHLDGVEVDEETHEVIGDTPLPRGLDHRVVQNSNRSNEGQTGPRRRSATAERTDGRSAPTARITTASVATGNHAARQVGDIETRDSLASTPTRTSDSRCRAPPVENNTAGASNVRPELFCMVDKGSTGAPDAQHQLQSPPTAHLNGRARPLRPLGRSLFRQDPPPW